MGSAKGRQLARRRDEAVRRGIAGNRGEAVARLRRGCSGGAGGETAEGGSGKEAHRCRRGQWACPGSGRGRLWRPSSSGPQERTTRACRASPWTSSARRTSPECLAACPARAALCERGYSNARASVRKSLHVRTWRIERRGLKFRRTHGLMRTMKPSKLSMACVNWSCWS